MGLMQQNSQPLTALFFSGVHLDLLGRLDSPALVGASNPGSFTAMPGGASLNCASVAALLGLQCSIIGLIGDDAAGVTITNTLKAHAIRDHLTICAGEATGTYTSIIEPDGNLHIAVADLGLNERITAPWLLDNKAEAMAAGDIWLINSNLMAEPIAALSDPSLPTRPKILAAASVSPSKSRNLAPSLGNVDVLFTNIAEASAMLNVLGGKPYDAARLDVHQCINRLRDLGVAKGTLSQGSDALWLWDETGVQQFIPPKLDKIIDVTGAGDALAGAFLFGLANGQTMAQSAPLAIAAAQMTIATLGPYNGEITLEELKLHAARVKAIS